VSKKSGPTPPPAPDPVKTSQAQSDANIATAREQQRLNMVNTQGPQGAVRYEADPTAPGGYRQVTELSAPEQGIYDAQKRTELGATNIAYDQLGRVQGALQTPLSTEGLGDLRSSYGVAPLSMNVADAGAIRKSFDTGPDLRYGFDQGQQVQGQVGGNQDLARLMASEANYRQMTSRLDPRFDREQRQLETKLANQGFSMNSEGYKNATSDFDRGKNDAYDQALLSSIREGEAAAQGQFGRQLSQGQFANQAAGQQYAQGLGSADFFNRTAGQDYGQNMGEAQFANTAQQQQFAQNLAQMQAQNAAAGQWTGQNQQAAQFGNEARNQGLQERAYLQNQPINQLSGLLGLGQVGMPQGIQYSPTSVGQTDVLGAYALNQQAQNAAYQAQMQNRSGLMGGLFSLGSAAIMSDRRLKTAIHLIRRRRDGLGIYSYRYKAGGPVRVGVMAQELLKVRPDLVERRPGGYFVVDYAGLDLEAA
jgi:hypothetical protein